MYTADKVDKNKNNNCSQTFESHDDHCPERLHNPEFWSLIWSTRRENVFNRLNCVRRYCASDDGLVRFFGHIKFSSLPNRAIEVLRH